MIPAFERPKTVHALGRAVTVQQAKNRQIASVSVRHAYFVSTDVAKAVEGMNCLRPLECCDCGFESHSRHGCLPAFVLPCVGSERPFDGLIPRPRNSTDCLRIKKLK
jgi:hypothetical protein